VPPHQLDVKSDVAQRHSFPGLVKFIKFILFTSVDCGQIQLSGVPPGFEGRLTLGYTEAHQPFQRRLVDAKDDSAAGVLAEEESKRGDQGRVERWHLRCETESRLVVVRAGNHVMTLTTRIDLGADRARIEQADALDTAVADGCVQLVVDSRDGEEIIGIGHRTAFRVSAPVARKVDARDNDRV
jgi:hypothetical protein